MTGNEIKTFRSSLGLTQTALGEKLGVAQVTIARWEKDHTSPENPQILRLALEYLLEQHSRSHDSVLREIEAQQKRLDKMHADLAKARKEAK
jgi:transcriptional regulator with XRE-family HTH domain